MDPARANLTSTVAARERSVVATGRDGSVIQSDHEPAYNAASMPAAASASTSCVAVTPDPQ